MSTSGSVKVPAGSVKAKAASCVAVRSAIGAASTGASLTLAMSSLKSPCASRPKLSVAVTRTTRLPTSALAGVPEKRCVAASNFSHDGSAAPEASWAA